MLVGIVVSRRVLSGPLLPKVEADATCTSSNVKPVQKACTKAAAELRAPMSAITIERVESVTWDNACLEVPHELRGGPCINSDGKPGRTPGYLVVLAHEHRQLVYHTDMTDLVIRTE
jgi:hypothetical protein